MVWNANTQSYEETLIPKDPKPNTDVMKQVFLSVLKKLDLFSTLTPTEAPIEKFKAELEAFDYEDFIKNNLVSSNVVNRRKRDTQTTVSPTTEDHLTQSSNNLTSAGSTTANTSTTTTLTLTTTATTPEKISTTESHNSTTQNSTISTERTKSSINNFMSTASGTEATTAITTTSSSTTTSTVTSESSIIIMPVLNQTQVISSLNMTAGNKGKRLGCQTGPPSPNY